MSSKTVRSIVSAQTWFSGITEVVLWYISPIITMNVSELINQMILF